MREDADGTTVLRDNGATIAPGQGCQAVDAHDVRCASTLGTTVAPPRR